MIISRKRDLGISASGGGIVKEKRVDLGRFFPF